MNRAVWHFDRKYKKPNETAKAGYSYFKKAVEDPTVFDECDLTEVEKEMLLTNIRNRMMPTPDKIRADIEVMCSGPDGIEGVKAALRHGIEVAREAAEKEGLVKTTTSEQNSSKNEEEENNNNTDPKNPEKDGPSQNIISITLIS